MQLGNIFNTLLDVQQLSDLVDLSLGSVGTVDNWALFFPAVVKDSRLVYL